MENHEKNSNLTSLYRDEEVMNELKSTYDFSEEKVRGGGLESFEIHSEPDPMIQGFNEITESSIDPNSPAEGLLEAIVMVTGRPVLLVQDGTFQESTLDTINLRLNKYRDKIEEVIPKVARIELLNSTRLEYLGTGWMISEDLMITNRHVASEFVSKRNNHYVFRKNLYGQEYDVNVNFKKEHERPKNPDSNYGILEVIHVEPNDGHSPDMALIRVKGENLPDPIPLSTASLEVGQDIAVVGYPAFDSRNDPAILNAIFNGVFNVKRLSPGKISTAQSGQTYFSHDCTTTGGSSGSVVFDMESGRACGLHFAGKFKQANYAVTAETIVSRMRTLLPTINFFQAPISPELSEIPTQENMIDRKGYDPSFLDERVELPSMSESLMENVAHTLWGGTELKYHNYSVLMHKKRKMAIYTVCNIDGEKLYGIKRGRDRWFYDPRMKEEYQAGQELYSRNNFHRGHLVRRLDPAWGNSRAEAEAAVEDTFFWTNCTPQHERFNPRTWLSLEDYILKNSRTRDIKVSVFTGPIFNERDLEYRNFKVPQEFWKVVVMINDETGALSATGYILSQSSFMDDAEFVFGEFNTYQVPISTIEAKTNLVFGLDDHDPIGTSESLFARTINSEFDLIL